MRRLLALLLSLLASPSWAGTNLLDASGNVVWADVSSLNIATAISGDTNTVTLRGQATATVQVTAAAAVTLQFEGTVAGGTFTAIPCMVTTTGVWQTSTTATGFWVCPVAGLATFRVRQSSTGSSTSSIIASQGSAAMYMILGYAQGGATLGETVMLDGGAVTTAAPAYTNLQTQPFSLTLAGGMRTDQSSQAGTAITSVPVAAGTGTLTGNAPVVNSAAFVGTTAAVASAAGVQKVGIAGGAAGAAIDAANNAAAPANVVVTGAQLQSSATATAGTAGQVGNVVAGLDHVLYARPGGPVLFNCGNNGVGTTLTQAVGCGALGAGLFYYVTSIVAQSTTAVGGLFTVTGGTGANCVTTNVAMFSNSTTATLLAPANTAMPLILHFPTPIKTTVQSQLLCVLGVITNTVNITITGFIAP